MLRRCISTPYKCTELLDPVTMGICQEKNLCDHKSLSNEETRNITKELDETDKKNDEATGAKLKYK